MVTTHMQGQRIMLATCTLDRAFQTENYRCVPSWPKLSEPPRF